MKPFKRKGNRLIAAALAVGLMITSLVIGLSGTFAAKPDKQVRLAQPNGNPVLAHGAVFEFNTSGVNSVSLVDTALGTASISNPAKSNAKTTLNLNGSKTAGVAAVMRGSAIGTVGVTSFQVVDPNNIAGYNLPNGGNGYIKEPRPGTPLSQSELGIKYYKIGAPATPTGAAETNSNTLTYVLDNSLASKVTWESLNWEVIDASLKPVGRGTTILLGTFTDRWGVKQTIAYLFGVGEVPNDSTMSDLLYMINKGKEILEDANANPGKYDPKKLIDLDNTIINGESVLENSASTDSDYKNASDNILDAIMALNECDHDFENLLELIPGPNGPDGKPGSWYRPLGNPPYVWEILNKDKSSKYPPEYVYNPSGDPNDGGNKPAYGPKDGLFWVQSPDYPNIYLPVDSDGNLSDEPAIWGGPDGAWGGGNDMPAAKGGDGAYYVNWGQNVFQKVNKTGANAGYVTGNPLIGGGPDETPGTSDDLRSNIILNVNDGKYYAGPFTDGDGDPYYVGDKRPATNGIATGGTGSGNTMHTEPINSTDRKYYPDGNGNMLPNKPVNITVITVTPNPANVNKGGSETFSASVTGTGSPGQTVTWTLEGARTSASTNISSSTGVLTVGADETASALTVRATSTVDTSKSGTATVNLITPITVTSVTVSPNPANVAKGKTQSFSVSVSGTGNPSQTVTWTLEGAKTSASTSINSSTGALTIGTDETATTLTVRATSTVDSSKSGTASVTITGFDTGVPGLDDSTTAGGEVTIDGYGWWVARTKTIGDQKFVMLVSKIYLGGYGLGFGDNSTYEGSRIQGRMTSYYSNMNIIKKIAVVPELQLNQQSSQSVTSEPSTTMALSQTKDIFFAMSWKDIEDWRPNSYSKYPYGTHYWSRTSIDSLNVWEMNTYSNIQHSGHVLGGNIYDLPAVWVRVK